MAPIRIVPGSNLVAMNPPEKKKSSKRQTAEDLLSHKTSTGEELPPGVYYQPSGKFTKDRALIRGTWFAFVCLMISWFTTVIASALPYWRTDKYSYGGYFTICSTAELTFVQSFDTFNQVWTGGYEAASTHSVQCYSLDAWCDKIDAMFVSVRPTLHTPNPTFDRYVNEAMVARSDVKLGLACEVIRLVLSMFFGLGTFYHVCWALPKERERSENARGMLCLVGILLTPIMIVVNVMVALWYWEFLGVGYFSRTESFAYFGPSAQAMVGTGMADLIIQLGYYSWGVRRNKKKMEGRILSEESALNPEFDPEKSIWERVD